LHGRCSQLKRNDSKLTGAPSTTPNLFLVNRHHHGLSHQDLQKKIDLSIPCNVFSHQKFLANMLWWHIFTCFRLMIIQTMITTLCQPKRTLHSTSIYTSLPYRESRTSPFLLSCNFWNFLYSALRSSIEGIFIGLTVVSALVSAALGVNHVVGGAGGCNLGTDLQTWASAQSSKTGDSFSKSTVSLKQRKRIVPIFVLLCSSKDECISLEIPQDACLYQTWSYYL